MSGLQLIELAEKRGFVDTKTAGRLREKLQAKADSVTANEVADHLVKRGRLTQYQADGLLASIRLIAQAADEGVDLMADTEEAMEVSSLELLEDGDELALVPLDVQPDRVEEVKPSALSPVENEESIVLESLQEDVEPLKLADVVHDVYQNTEQPPLLAGWKSLFTRKQGWQGRQRGGPNFLMLGSGALILMSVLGAFLFFFLTRETGDEFFDAAQQDYQAEAYDNAIKKYDLFVEKFAKHPKYSWAKVRSQLARIRKSIQSNAWDQALEAVRSGLDEVRNEPAFDQAPPELASILPKIYEGFVQRAAETDDIAEKQGQLSKAAAVWAFIEDPQLLPGSQRRAIELHLKSIQKEVALVEREIARQRGLEEALQQIKTAVTEDRDSVKAYAIHQQVLKQYPGLRTNKRLASVLKLIADREKDAVIVTLSEQSAETQDHRVQVAKQVLLAKRRGGGTAAASGHVFSVAHGALYGLSATDGRVLWRRYVGLAASELPLAVGQGEDNDVLMVDPRRQELLRLKGSDGQLVWRLPIGEPCAQPVVTLEQVFVATQSGKLMSVDPKTGSVGQVAQLPQRLYSPPTVDTSRHLVYQVGDHSSVFVFEAESLKCLGVYVTGHPAGSVSTPPILVGDHLLVPEKSGADHSRLIPLALKDGLVADGEEAPAALLIDGHVTQASAVADKAAVVATDSGASFIVASVGITGDEQVRVLARTPSTGSSESPHFGLLFDDRILIAGRGLQRFEFQSANGTLVSRWAFSEPSVHVAPPLRRGNVLFVQYKRPASQAVRVAAMNFEPSDDAPKLRWTVDLGSAPAGPPIFNKPHRNIVVVSSDSSAWELGSSALKAGLLDQTAADLPGQTLFHGGQMLPDESIFFAARDHQKGYLIYDARQPGSHLQRREVRVPESRLACTLVVAGNQLIACTANGFVYLIDPKTGKPTAEPYQPEMKIGMSVDWIPPTMLPGGDIVVGTSSGELRLLKSQLQPQPRLVADTNQVYPAKYDSSLLAAGENVFVLSKTGATHAMVCLQGTDLAPLATTALGAASTAGPFQVGDFVVCTTHDQNMHAFTADGKRAWTAALPHSPLAGPPIVDDDTWICASANGQLWRTLPESGQLLSWDGREGPQVFDVGEPLGTPPLRMASRLLVLGRDCTLFVLSLP